jgi:hypothetical protein
MPWCSTCGDRLPDGSRYCLTCQRLLEKNEVRRSPLFPIAKALEKGKQEQKEQREQLTGFQKALMIGLAIGYMALSSIMDSEESSLPGALLLLFAFVAISFLPKLFDRSEDTAPGAEPGSADEEDDPAEDAPGFYPTTSGVEQWGDADER